MWNWCFIVYSGDREVKLDFLNFCRHSGKENPETLFTCRRVSVMYDVKRPGMAGILVIIYGRDTR